MPPGNPACIFGAPLMLMGVNDLIEAKTGSSGLEILSEQAFGDPMPGKKLDTVLDFIGGSSALIKAPFKMMTKQPDLILDATIDVGTGAADVYKSIDSYESW